MKDIKNFLICGGGMMGSAIAQVLAGIEGSQITVYDVYPVDIEAKIRGNMKLLVEKGIVTEADVDNVVSKIRFTQDLNDEGVKCAQMVVECVLEEMELKQNLFAQLEDYVSDDTIFCTNTSVMSPTEISAKCKHKERLCGTHFWNPAFLIPLVEVVKTPDTTDEVADTVMDILTRAGKKPVLCKKDVPALSPTVCSTLCGVKQFPLWREVLLMQRLWMTRASTVSACAFRTCRLWSIPIW